MATTLDILVVEKAVAEEAVRRRVAMVAVFMVVVCCKYVLSGDELVVASLKSMRSWRSKKFETCKVSTCKS